MVKVNAPTVLTIGAGAADNSEMIDLANIDVERKVGSTRVFEGEYVFAVRGKYISAYDLQIARTTNIPFTYEVYRVSKVEKQGGEENLRNGLGTTNSVTNTALNDGSYNGTVYKTADYTSADSVLYYYPYIDSGVNSTMLSGDFLNDKTKTGTIGGDVPIGDGEESINQNETFHKHNYGTGANTTYDNVNEYAEPLYWQALNIPVNYKSDTGDFVDYYVLKLKWTSQFSNNKETDMIYITARRH